MPEMGRHPLKIQTRPRLCPLLLGTPGACRKERLPPLPQLSAPPPPHTHTEAGKRPQLFGPLLVYPKSHEVTAVPWKIPSLNFKGMLHSVPESYSPD